jgi:hypothetical protein
MERKFVRHPFPRVGQRRQQRAPLVQLLDCLGIRKVSNRTHPCLLPIRHCLGAIVGCRRMLGQQLWIDISELERLPFQKTDHPLMEPAAVFFWYSAVHRIPQERMFKRID